MPSVNINGQEFKFTVEEFLQLTQKAPQVAPVAAQHKPLAEVPPVKPTSGLQREARRLARELRDGSKVLRMVAIAVAEGGAKGVLTEEIRQSTGRHPAEISRSFGELENRAIQLGLPKEDVLRRIPEGSRKRFLAGPVLLQILPSLKGRP